jgi:hypothetical protein
MHSNFVNLSKFLHLLLFNFRQKVCVGVPMELPNVNSVFISRAYDSVVVTRIKYNVRNRERMSNKRLKVVGRCFHCVVVPDLYKIIRASSQHKAAIETKISCVD